MFRRRTLTASLLLSAMAAAACSGANDDGDAVTSAPEVDVTSTQQELAMLSTNLWPANSGGLTVVRVCFTNGTADQRTNVREVAEGSWESIGATFIGPFGRYGVDFTEWGNCPGSTAGWIPITFTNAEPNHVEGLGKAITRMTLHTTAADATIMHEFGHALGFTHEFNRSDYDDVDPDCTASGGTIPDYAVTTADTTSIMNYTQCGRTGQLTLGDVFGFAGLYGPWDVTPGGRFAIRHDNTLNYIRADSSPDVNSALIREEREFQLEIVVGGANGKVNHGDTVRLKTFDNQYLRANGSGGFVTKTTSTSSSTHWVIQGTVTTGTPVRVNDRVTFWSQHSLGRIRKDPDGRLITSAGLDNFRMVSVGAGLTME